MNERPEIAEPPKPFDEDVAIPGQEDGSESASPLDESREAEPRLDEEVIRRLDLLTEAVDQNATLRAKDQQIAERLHEENEKLRLGEVREIQRPLVSDIAQLLYLVSKESSASPQERSRLDFLQDGLLEILASAGVIELSATEGDVFQRGLHKAVEKMPTTDEGQSGCIAEVKRAGFGWTDGTVLRPAEVTVFVFEPEKGQPAGEHEGSSGSPDDSNETESEEGQ